VGHLVWQFQLSPVIQSGARETIAELQKQGYEIKLLSGDSEAETLKIAQELGISKADAFYQMTPQEKADMVRLQPQSIMVGDGVNDTLALQAASVGIAVNGGVELALKSADVLFLKEGLSSLKELFQISKRARLQIQKNLSSALVYNILGGLAALLGFVNPFVAALLMPASSMFILTSTWWGTKS
jgi:P-type E1-E2 ATPase